MPEPTTIVDQPVPFLDGGMTDATGSNSSGESSQVVTPKTIVNEPYTRRIIAVETISESLDTESRAIKGEYTFEQLGSIRIGSYVPGVSGEIDISPSGILGVNDAGETTFAIDGDTGDATFLGTLQAGTLIGGDSNVVIDVGGSGGGRIIFYNSGVPVIIIGDPS